MTTADDIKYTVIEMQNGAIDGRSWCYDDRESAEVKLYQVLSEVVKSPIKMHTVMLVTSEGSVLDRKAYVHDATTPTE